MLFNFCVIRPIWGSLFNVVFYIGSILWITKHMLFYFRVSLTFWRDQVVKDVVNKFGGPKSIIKLSNNNLMHNYMFSVIYRLGKMTSFAIFLFQLWAFTNGGLAYTCFESDLMQKAAFIKSYITIRLLRKKRGYLTSIERKKGGWCKLSVPNMYK